MSTKEKYRTLPRTRALSLVKQQKAEQIASYIYLNRLSVSNCSFLSTLHIILDGCYELGIQTSESL